MLSNVQDALIMCSTLFALASTGGGGTGGGEDQKVNSLTKVIKPLDRASR